MYHGCSCCSKLWWISPLDDYSSVALSPVWQPMSNGTWISTRITVLTESDSGSKLDVTNLSPVTLCLTEKPNKVRTHHDLGVNRQGSLFNMAIIKLCSYEQCCGGWVEAKQEGKMLCCVCRAFVVSLTQPKMHNTTGKCKIHFYQPRHTFRQIDADCTCSSLIHTP